MYRPTKFNRTLSLSGALVMLSAAGIQQAAAAVSCVNPGGTAGCYASINVAVAAANPYDTINVVGGVYKEDVVIGKPLSLSGTGPSAAVINAAGRSNGIYVDGIDNPGLSGVTIAGFTIVNANFEGILVTNASSVTIANNRVLNNNKSLDLTSFSCPGLPAFETEEGEDCGEGIHLIGATHSTVAKNAVEGNSGGILLSDETAPVSYNLITGNVVMNNPYDCGITLASHSPAPTSGSSVPFGIVHNTIEGNTSNHNGTQVPGAGAGVGMFSGTSAGIVSGNVVINNTATDNGLPGVVFHSHAPGDFILNNLVAGNKLSGNGADTGDAATPAPAGINVFGVSALTGTVITGNVIDNEGIAVAVNTPANVQVHLNDFSGGGIGVDNLGTTLVIATENWWGCPGGPSAAGCSTASGPVLVTPWLNASF